MGLISMKISLSSLMLTTILLGQISTSQAAESELQINVQSAMTMDYRTEADTKRDMNRSPAQALAFFDFKQNMKVIEFAPGNGWYSKILAPLLAEKGELYLAYKAEWLNNMDELLKHKAFKSAKKLPIPLSWNNKEYRYDLGKLSFGMTNADMVLNIREYHNFNEEDKTKLNNAAFSALKSGGTYVIIDHTRRHMIDESRELSRREDPVTVILEVQKAGFILEKSSNMFSRPDDELIYEVGRKTVTGNTDRFTLVFKKP
jgi:predicted methyltransferase